MLLPLLAVAANVISHGYQTNQDLPAGAAVSLVQNKIELANNQNQQNLYGVVVRPTDVSVNIDAIGRQVEVVTNGLVSVAVSDINGGIQNGDQLSPSPIAGVAMKATDTGKVLGKAASGFSASSAGVTTQSLTAKDGSAKKVAIGTIPVNVEVKDYSAQGPGLPSVLAPFSSLFSSVAGHQVSSTRTIASLVIFAAAMIVAMVILYSAVSGSVRSLGRNPLSRGAIFAGLLQVVVVVIVVLLMAFSIIVIIIRG